MTVSLHDWVFEVDVDATMAYCGDVVADPCECGYCRNFRAAVNNTFPELHQTLVKFGSRVDAPEELMPYEPTIFEASYCISGTVIKTGLQPIKFGACSITVLQEDQTDYPTQCPHPYFVLRTGCLELPWVLDEDMDEVVSPANDPEYLQRMWDRLLQNAPNDTIN